MMNNEKWKKEKKCFSGYGNNKSSNMTWVTLGVRSDHKTVNLVSYNYPKVTIMFILVTINYENL